MPWSSSNRRAELPPDWEQRRRACQLNAGGRCEAAGSAWPWPSDEWRGTDGRCVRLGTDADHKGYRWDHDDLQWLCDYHHKSKTSQESAAARAENRKKLSHPTEKNPGLR